MFCSEARFKKGNELFQVMEGGRTSCLTHFFEDNIRYEVWWERDRFRIRLARVCSEKFILAFAPTRPYRSWRFHFKNSNYLIEKKEDEFWAGSFEERNLERQKAEEERKAKVQERAEQTLARAIQENYSLYEKIIDKELFHKQMLAFLDEEFFEIFGNKKHNYKSYFEDFCNCESFMENFIKGLTVESVLNAHPKLLSYGLKRNVLSDILQQSIQKLIKEERWSPSIYFDYKDAVYSDLELVVRRHIEEEKIKKIKEQYPLQYFYDLYADKIELSRQQDVLKKDIEEVYERNFSWQSSIETIEKEIGKAIDDFLVREEENRRHESFVKQWGREYTIELTPEKEELFLKAEQGENVEELIRNEYILYKELLADYNKAVYTKRGKVKPSVLAAEKCVSFFNDLAYMVKDKKLIDENGNFDSTGNLESFKRAARKYERQQENKK